MQLIQYKCKWNVSRAVNLHHTGDHQLSNPYFKVTALLEHSSERLYALLECLSQVISTHLMCTHCVCFTYKHPYHFMQIALMKH